MTKEFEQSEIKQKRSDTSDGVAQELKNELGTHPILKSVHVMIPIHNEAARIKSLIIELLSTLETAGYAPSIMLIDDGSSDNSKEIITELSYVYKQVNFISFSRNFGKEAAIMAGFNEAGNNFSLLAYMDGDGQHSPKDLVRLLRAAENPEIDMACGVRQDRDYQTKIQRMVAQLFYKMFEIMGQTQIEPGIGDFNVLKPKVVNALKDLNEEHPFLKGLLAWVGFRKQLVPISIRLREGGVSKSSFRRLFKLGFGAVLSFSSLPLRLWSLVGAFFAFLSISYLVTIIVDVLVYGRDIPGYASTIVLLLGIGGLQLLSIGIIGEYIARIYDVSKGRPRYIISERGNLNE